MMLFIAAISLSSCDKLEELNEIEVLYEYKSNVYSLIVAKLDPSKYPRILDLDEPNNIVVDYK